jgi:hypothetical protein
MATNAQAARTKRRTPVRAKNDGGTLHWSMSWGAVLGAELGLIPFGFAVVSVPHYPIFWLARALFVSATLIFVGKAMMWGWSQRRRALWIPPVALMLAGGAITAGAEAFAWLHADQAAEISAHESQIHGALRPVAVTADDSRSPPATSKNRNLAPVSARHRGRPKNVESQAGSAPKLNCAITGGVNNGTVIQNCD